MWCDRLEGSGYPRSEKQAWYHFLNDEMCISETLPEYLSSMSFHWPHTMVMHFIQGILIQDGSFN
jgi:hypothetical protein